MADVDRTVKQYLYELLSDENQKLINDKLREYAQNEKDRARAFNEAIRKQAKEKQKQVDNYLSMLGSGMLPPRSHCRHRGENCRLKKRNQKVTRDPHPQGFYRSANF